MREAFRQRSENNVGGVLDVFFKGLHPLRAHRAVYHSVVSRSRERHEFGQTESGIKEITHPIRLKYENTHYYKEINYYFWKIS